MAITQVGVNSLPHVVGVGSLCQSTSKWESKVTLVCGTASDLGAYYCCIFVWNRSASDYLTLTP